MIIDVGLEIILAQTLQIVVLKQLNAFLVLEHLNSRDEDLTF